MPSVDAKFRDKFPMGGKETLLMFLRPHPLSFFRYYSVGIVLLIWVVLAFWLESQGWLTFDFLWDEMNQMMPALFMALGAFIVGLWLVDDFGKGFRYLYWFAVIALLVVAGLFIWNWKDPDMARIFAFLYGTILGLMGILFAELYRRAFSYLVTNQRVVLRYRLLSIEETNMRFEKIEDFEIIRPFWFRLVGLGVIRPYTGSEDAKADSDREHHGPMEAMYGIPKPNEVKRQLIEIILERDDRDRQMVDLLEDQKKQKPKPSAPVKAPPPVAVEAAPVVAATAAPEEEPAADNDIRYYQPAPAPEPAPAPPPSKNYERIDPSQFAQPEEDAPMPPPPPDDETDPEPQPSPVRTMYPEAKEPEAPLEMEDTRSVDFERGARTRPSDAQKRVTEEEEGWRKRDETKPKSL